MGINFLYDREGSYTKKNFFLKQASENDLNATKLVKKNLLSIIDILVYQ